jgi:hypothetical protein
MVIEVFRNPEKYDAMTKRALNELAGIKGISMNYAEYVVGLFNCKQQVA